MLKVNNVYKSYKNHNVLKGVSFELLDGEIKAVIGVNGAGKTTLIEIICGVKTFDEGEVIIDGMDLSKRTNYDKIKRILGYMPQTFCLFNDLTVEENLKYLAIVYDLNKDRVNEVINICGLESKRSILASKLSGGYKQLLSMASAIIHQPKILILDEPTTNMDPFFRKQFWNVVLKCKEQQVSILVITHYMEELVKCDSYSLLSKGKIVYDGSTEELKDKNFLQLEESLYGLGGFDE